MFESRNMLISKKLAVFAAMICAIIALPARQAFPAASCTTTPTAAQVSQLKWGTLQIPAASTTYTVSGTTGATSGTGTLIYGTPARGQYTIGKNGNENKCSTLTINVTSANCVAPGCTLSNWTGNYNGANLVGGPPWSGLTMPGTGKTLYLGATATYTGSATAGSFTPTFTIAAHYDALSDTTQPQTGAIGFDLPVSIDTVNNVNMGTVKALTAGTYIIDTTGNVAASGGGVWLFGTHSAGSLLIHGSATQTISISAGSYTSGGAGGGVTLSAATCSYNGGSPVACTLSTQAAPGSAGKTLLMGITATVNSSQTQGSTATPTFTITVTYT
jgi:hypothetical protein